MRIEWIDKLTKIARQKSPWVYHINSGSCNGCDIEIGPCFVPAMTSSNGRYFRRQSQTCRYLTDYRPHDPAHLRSGMGYLCPNAEPKAVIAIGSCPATGNVFAGSPTVLGSVEPRIPVDIYVPGCPPRPQTIMEAIRQAAQLLAEGKTGKKQGVSS